MKKIVSCEMGLCEQCQSISSTVLSGLKGKTVLQHNNETLARSVFDSKCFLCTQVWNSLTEEQREVTRRPEFEGITYIASLETAGWDYGPEDILATIYIENGEDLYCCEDYNLVGGTLTGDSGQYAILRPSIHPPEQAPVLADRTDHPSCWATVSNWIEECSKHDTCQGSQKGSWLPTRLVDLQDYKKGRIRVVHTSRVSRRPAISYLALSHCWGRKPFLTMKKQNKKKFKKGVRIASLARNFQDAISVAHRLGFRYIWIDSLCIIQGSPEDWRREAATMNQVYRNAFLTIGAMASSDAHGGLFRKRDPEMTGTCPITINTEAEGLIKCLLVKSDIWDSQVKQAPLSKRAWVLQERILSPRSLYFCEGQLFWECREQHACECLPKGVPLELITDIKEPMAAEVVPIKAFETAVERVKSVDPWEVRMADNDTPWVHRQYEDAYMVWNDILESYARCALTNPGDKFVAISGVAKDFATAINDEYLAGLWRGDFIPGLLWTSYFDMDRFLEGFVPAVRSPVYRAPSWSWASLDAPHMRTQRTKYRMYGDYAEVLDVGIELATGSKDPTGALRHACLHISGHLVRTRRKPVYRDNCRYFGSFIPDVEDFEGENFYCFPLREELTNKKPYLTGLVLTPWVDDGEWEMPLCSKCTGKAKFQRVGVFECEQGDPLRYLSMRKPEDWVDWGEESDHLWFPEDTNIWDFIIV